MAAAIIRGRKSPTPKYFQLEELLRKQLANWKTNRPIPTEFELCEKYEVSRTTVRKALDDLEREGLLYRVQGIGTFTMPVKLRERFVQRSAGFYEDMVSRGYTVSTRVLEHSVVRASQQVASELQLAAGEKVVKMVRLRLIDNDPILISTSFVSHRRFPDLINDDLTHASLYQLLREKYGVNLTHGTRLVEAASCTPEEARLLHIKPNTPLLVVSGTVFDKEGHPVEHGFARHRGDRSQVEIEIATP